MPSHFFLLTYIFCLFLHGTVGFIFYLHNVIDPPFIVLRFFLFFCSLVCNFFLLFFTLLFYFSFRLYMHKFLLLSVFYSIYVIFSTFIPSFLLERFIFFINVIFLTLSFFPSLFFLSSFLLLSEAIFVSSSCLSFAFVSLHLFFHHLFYSVSLVYFVSSLLSSPLPLCFHCYFTASMPSVASLSLLRFTVLRSLHSTNPSPLFFLLPSPSYPLMLLHLTTSITITFTHCAFSQINHTIIK